MSYDTRYDFDTHKMPDYDPNFDDDPGVRQWSQYLGAYIEGNEPNGPTRIQCVHREIPSTGMLTYYRSMTISEYESYRIRPLDWRSLPWKSKFEADKYQSPWRMILVIFGLPAAFILLIVGEVVLELLGLRGSR